MGVIIPQVVTEDKASGAQVIDGGLRFDSAKSQRLDRTPGSAGNRKTFTWSGWVKRSKISSTRFSLFVAATGGNNQTEFFFEQSTGADTLHFYHYNNSYLGQCRTVSVFRDTSAWYHIVVSIDTTQSTASNRCKIYVNGVQQDTTFLTNFTLNDDLYVNAANSHSIGYDVGNAPGQTYYFDGFLSNIYLIDGQALDPSYFGYTDALTNTWRPKKYTGTYGTNGFYLPMDGNTPIGQDRSGNNNNWTPVNFGGSNTLEKATGALPILNTDGGGKVARVGVRTDSNASSLVLALPLVGIKSDFSNRVNSGTTEKAITANGNAAASSAQSNFYGGSFYFDGNGDWLSLTGLSNLTDCTIECWFYATTLTPPVGNINPRIASSGQYNLVVQTDGAVRVDLPSSYTTSTGIVVAGKWYHIAHVRSGSSNTVYLDGVQILSFTNSNTITGSSFVIGREDNVSSWWSGYIQDFRVYTSAKYTQNFIPASTDPDILPDTPSGVAYSSNVALVPSTDGAVSFTGIAGTYLSGASTSQFTTDAQYTIDGFVYISSAPSSGNAVPIFDTGSGGNDPEFNIYNNSGNLQLYDSLSNNANWTGGAPYMSTGRWHYIKQTVNGTSSTDSAATHKLYLDGQLGVSNTINLSARSASSTFAIGARTNGTIPFTGFISNLRYRNVVDDSLTVPTSGFSTDANTKLLCCKSNSSATAADVTPGTITANGNAAATNFNPFTVNINTQRGQESGYCTMNVLDQRFTDNGTFSNGNLRYTQSSTGARMCRATIGVSSGKWYWEWVNGGGNNSHGISLANESLATYAGGTAGSYAYWVGGEKYNNSSSSSYGAAISVGDVVGTALDLDAGTLTFYKNGISQGIAFSGLSGTFFPAFGSSSVSVVTFDTNFGQKPFKFPPPAGFQPLALANTPRPTIVRPDQYVGIVTYTGNTPSSQSINVGFKPDFVWFKSRSGTTGHALYDSVRGTTKSLSSNETSSEYTATNASNDLVSFNRNGFTVGPYEIWNSVNNGSIVAWCWKAGGNSNTYNINDVGYATTTAAGLTAGTIAPTGASINTKSGFSIITFTAQSSGSASISHGLGNAPGFIIVKSRNQTYNWLVYHKNLTSNAYYLILNSTAGQDNASNAWNSTTPTSDVFTLGSTYAGAGDTVAYLWAEIPGFSRAFSYTGNGSADGPVVNLGFLPRLILLKNTTAASTNNWVIYDTERNKFNETNFQLWPNSSAGGNTYEATASNVPIDVLSNGFKIRSTGGDVNTSTNTYIGFAWASSPTFNLYGGQSNAR